MNCNDFELNVLRLARNDLIDVATRKLCLEHTEACSSCANQLAEEQALMACIRSVVAEIAGEEAPARVEESLLVAFREQAAPAIHISANRQWWHWQFAAAAIILILISAGGIFWLHRDAGNREQANKPSAPRPAVTPKSADKPITREPEIAQQPHRSPSQSRVHRQGSRHAAVPAEQVTEFFPLMDGVDLNSLEAVQVVRIELPASELRNFGLPLAADMTSAAVKADVVLGYDGQARAIRLVR